MFLLNLIILLYFASRGYSATVEDILDGVEKTRTTNIQVVTDFIQLANNQNPGKNIVLTAMPLNYCLGTFASFARCSCVADSILGSLNYKSLDQIQNAIPVVTNEVQSFSNTISAWAGALYTDINNIVLRKFTDVFYNSFNSDVRNTDFSNPELAASVINQMANVNSIGYGTTGTFVSTDMIAADERFFILVTEYFEGGFTSLVNPCDTEYRNFFLASGIQKLVPTMRLQGEQGYGKMVYGAKILQLTFQGNIYTMNIVIPKCFEDIPDILKVLRDPSQFDKIFSKIQKRQLEIYMPKIDIHENSNFLGLYEQVINKINLTKIQYDGMFENSRNAYVSQILVDIHLRINEGKYNTTYTESCPENEESMKINVDSPFIYYICSKSGIPMLAGIYAGAN